MITTAADDNISCLSFAISGKDSIRLSYTVYNFTRYFKFGYTVDSRYLDFGYLE